MKLARRDRSMTLAVAAPGMGFALTLDGHLWLWDRDGNITGSVPSAEGHYPASSPQACPRCAPFLEKNYSTGEAGEL